MSRFRWDLTLPDGLEGDFDRRMNETSRRQIVVALGVVGIVSLIGLGADANAGILHEALLSKLVLQLPITFAGLVFVLRSAPSSRWLWLAGILPITATILVVTALGSQTEPLMASRYMTIAGLAAVFANIALPIKFPQAVVFAITNVGLLVGVPFALEPFESVASYLDVLLFMGAIIVVTPVLVYNRERSQKNAFLTTIQTERQALEYQALADEMTKLAHRDPLTKVGNRRSFDIRLHALWQTATVRNEDISLILVDIDHFKALNDSVGHREGDRCLQAVAKAIARGAKCPLDHIARYGGEEFAVLLRSGTGETAEAIRASVETLSYPHPGLKAGSVVTVSIGKATASPATEPRTIDDLIEAADRALYEAKSGGRNRVVLHDRFKGAA